MRLSGAMVNRLKRAGHRVVQLLPPWLPRTLSGLAWIWLVEFSAGASTNPVIPYSVRIWQADEGLPQNSVFAITQTKDGYLWVGTRGGLARFDGMRFVSLDETAPAELRRGWIRALWAGQDGSLWIACDSYGLARLNQGVFTHFSETDGLPSNQTRCLLEARDGSLWIEIGRAACRERE